MNSNVTTVYVLMQNCAATKFPTVTMHRTKRIVHVIKLNAFNLSNETFSIFSFAFFNQLFCVCVFVSLAIHFNLCFYFLCFPLLFIHSLFFITWRFGWLNIVLFVNFFFSGKYYRMLFKWIWMFWWKSWKTMSSSVITLWWHIRLFFWWRRRWIIV